MAGALYFWIMLAFALGCGGVLLLVIALLFVGHWLEKKETGATHGFLELPHHLSPAAPPPETQAPSPAQPSPNSEQK